MPKFMFTVFRYSQCSADALMYISSLYLSTDPRLPVTASKTLHSSSLLSLSKTIYSQPRYWWSWNQSSTHQGQCPFMSSTVVFPTVSSDMKLCQSFLWPNFVHLPPSRFLSPTPWCQPLQSPRLPCWLQPLCQQNHLANCHQTNILKL